MTQSMTSRRGGVKRRHLLLVSRSALVEELHDSRDRCAIARAEYSQAEQTTGCRFAAPSDSLVLDKSPSERPRFRLIKRRKVGRAAASFVTIFLDLKLAPNTRRASGSLF